MVETRYWLELTIKGIFQPKLFYDCMVLSANSQEGIQLQDRNRSRKTPAACADTDTEWLAPYQGPEDQWHICVLLKCVIDVSLHQTGKIN